MSRGNYLQQTGGTYTSDTGRGGNHNTSVYQTPDTGTSLPTGQPPTGGDPNWRPSGGGSAGVGFYLRPTEVLDNFANDSGVFDIGGGHFGDSPQDEWYQPFLDYGMDTTIFQIGKHLYNGNLFNAAGEWLGDLADSPWNPINWETGEPPTWSISMGDPRSGDGSFTVLARGVLEPTEGSGQFQDAEFDDEGRATDVDTGAGGTTNITRETLTPDDEGYIDYLNSFENPEELELEDGFMYDYSTGEIVDLRGDPYAYRRIDYSNAWKNSGINDLLLSDEDWNLLTEEEKQANFDARQAIATNDSYNFGSELINPSPFGSLPDVWESENPDEEFKKLKEMYLNGEITSTELLRYQDDILRFQNNSSQQDAIVGNNTNLLALGGFTEEQIAEYTNEFTSEIFDTTGIRDKEGFFDVFQNNINSLREVDVNATLSAYDMYDEKRDYDYSNAFKYLDTVRGTDAFIETYSALDFEKRQAYLTYMHNELGLSSEDYQKAVAQNLAAEGKFVFQLEDGRYAVGTEDGIYADHYIITDPTQEQYDEARYYQYEKDKTLQQATSVEGGDEEFNARRARIAAYDNAGGVTTQFVEAIDRPEESIGDKVLSVVKVVALNAMTGGLYSAIPAGINILKGEADTSDWVSFTPVALEASGAITPPASMEDAQRLADETTELYLAKGYSPSEAAQWGQWAKEGALAGKGLDLGSFQMSYDDTLLAVDAATTGDIERFIINKYAVPYIKEQAKGLWNDISVDPPELVEQWQEFYAGMSDPVKAGLNKTMEEMLKGKSFDEAATKGLIEYLDESDFENIIEDRIREVGSKFDDEYLQPIKNYAESVFDESAAKYFLSNFDDQYLQPAKQTVVDAADPVTEFLEETGDVVEEGGQKVVDVITDATDPIIDAGEDVIDVIEEGGQEAIDYVRNLFEGDEDDDEEDSDFENPLESVDTDFPDISLDYVPNKRGTRTSDFLFSDLFKFKTEIGATQPTELITYEDLQGNDPLGRTI